MSFLNHDVIDYRDSLEVSNYAATHYKVREGISSSTNQDFTLMVPEGWTRLKVLVDGKHFKLDWLSENSQVTLLSQSLDFTADTVMVRGIFSHCSGDSPEFDICDGKQETVPLQPMKSEQYLELTGQSNATLYLDDPSDTRPLPTNITLTAKIQWSSSQWGIGIMKDDEELYNITQPRWPELSVKSKGGNTQLRLTMSKPYKDEPCSQSHAHTSTSTIIAAILGTLLVVSIIGNIVQFALLQKIRKIQI